MSQSSEILNLLETSPLFLGVSHRDIIAVLRKSQLVSLGKGNILLKRGEYNNNFYLILSGRLNIQMSEAGAPFALAGQSECVGEMSTLGDGFASAFVVAATECKLVAISQAAIWELIDTSHQAALNILRILSHRFSFNSRTLSDASDQQSGYTEPSMVDELTGLYNRNWMNDKLERYLQRGNTNNQPGCLVMLEMDGYDKFSDEFGMLGADLALRSIAHSMLTCLRPDDQAGHYMGPKFSIFLPNTSSLSDAGIAGERLRIAIKNAPVVLPSGDALPAISVSLGIAQARQNDRLATLIERAMNALHQAQVSGGNCVKLET